MRYTTHRMKPLLLVEDDVRIGQSLSQGLQEAGYEVVWLQDGETALGFLARHEPLLVILDVMLPRYDGWQVLTQLREQTSQLPVLMLSALSDVEHRVKGLTHGADDYLAKPFALNEVLARVDALLRRTRNQAVVEILTVGDLKLHLKTQQVTRQNKRIDLTTQEFKLLLLLAQRQGQMMTRKTLMEEVWDIHFECDTNLVDVAIRRLRKKLEQGFETPLIHTIRGVGYCLEGRTLG
ncbi:MAG: winged helix-turn-helix domain-containing protein [Vampirovibrionales bacterium]